ncbi:MAG: glucan 1,4-alpha-glucosidase [Flavobacteriaceae bacterium]|nr:MAG: glucan 1,4-alpha-glucosidase [Flavobacteriaceae bacterium]
MNAQDVLEVTPLYANTSLSFELRATDLVSQMTLDEKISQLGNKAPAIPRLGINEYEWWNEGLHGVARAGIATVFPQAIAMAASFDTESMLKVAGIISDEARAKHHEALRNKNYKRYFGLTYWSPNINIFRDPRWGRGHETYGEDPYLTGQMGVQFVKGLQGNDPKYLKLVATAKHFAVHNGPEADRHFFNVTPNTRDLWETYLPAFESLVTEASVNSIMGAYNRVDGESATASWMLLEGILRNKWGFKGFVVSDCGAIRDIYAYHNIVNTPEEAAAVGVRRGCDLNCGDVYQNALKRAVTLGLIDEGEIDVSVFRLMLARMKLGMFDPESMVPFASIPLSVNNSEAHNKMALTMAQKSMTLLKNDGLLPLNKKKIKSIAIVGPNGNSVPALYANYNGIASNPITVIEGIKRALHKSIKISYNMGVPLVFDKGTPEKYTIIDASNLSFVNKNGKKKKGLKGAYFNNIKLANKPVFSRIDALLNFNWEGSPNQTELSQGIILKEQFLPKDNFSVRWQGKLLAPKTGQFNLGLIADDGCRLWINNKLVADGWTDHGMELFMGKVSMEKGQYYDVKIEYYEKTQGAGIKFVWEVPGTTIKESAVAMTQLSEETLKDVKNADVAVFVGGLDASWEGEEMGGRTHIDGFYKGDRTKIELPKVQVQAIRQMLKTGTPVVLVLMAGSAIALDGLESELEAVLMGWYPGQRGGDAIADVLFGDYNPAGRLPVTFYKNTAELPDFSDYNMRAGKGFTYRFYKGKALFPFGHGLSYTTFKYKKLQVNYSKVANNASIEVSLIVKNTGNVQGDEVVQLYIKDVESNTWMVRKQLRKFRRISLKPGEEKRVRFTLNTQEDMSYYNARFKKFMVEPGAFEIQIGASSEDIRLKKIIDVSK